MSTPTIDPPKARPRSTGDPVAAVKSAVFPGWGQWGQGRRRSAMLYFRGLIVVATAGLALVAMGPARLAEMLVTPSAFLALMAGFVLTLGLWLASIWDAWTEGGRRKGAGRGGLVIMAVVAIPLLWVGYSYLVRPYQTLTRVFGDTVQAAPSTPTGVLWNADVSSASSPVLPAPADTSAPGKHAAI